MDPLALPARLHDLADVESLVARLCDDGAPRALDLREARFTDDAREALVRALGELELVTSVRVGDALPPDARETLVAALCARAPRRPAARERLRAHATAEVRAAPTDDELEACARVLRSLADDPRSAAAHPALRALAARVARAERAERDADARREAARARRAARAQRDRARAETTGIHAARRGEAPPTVTPEPLETPRPCYVCRAPYRALHFFYDRLCPACAAFNWEKRGQTADLRGRVALVTGARVRIGYAVALSLLRAGATVVATTRFARDAAARYAREPDFEAWRDRLRVRRLDLRDIPAVERFVEGLHRELDGLDVLVNNAAQTVWRPPAWYARLAAVERAPASELPAAVRAVLDETTSEPAAREEVAALDVTGEGDDPLFPAGSDDGTGHPVDLRAVNSWRLAPGEVSTRELLEALTINAVGPYLLTVRLEGLMTRGPAADRWVVQVSSPEGSFARGYRSGLHAHTNMAKAALNMLVRTASEAWARRRVWMCAVDTGWVSNQNPHPLAETMAAQGFAPPLDERDAAARVLDPVFTGAATGRNIHGVYLKDYKPAPW